MWKILKDITTKLADSSESKFKEYSQLIGLFLMFV